jgi:hypothetical protein
MFRVRGGRCAEGGWAALRGVRASLIVCSLLAGGRHCGADSIVLARMTAAGVPLLVLSVDLNDPRVKVTGVVARGGCGNAERFDSMIHRTHPTAAVTGTFFCEQSLAPIGDIVVNGHLTHRGGIGTGLCLTDDNQCDFVHPPHRYAYMDWSRYDFVCCSGPRLVCEGVPGVYPGSEGFRDPHLLHSNTRLAVGITRKNKLLFVATRKAVQLGQMARALRKLGCMDAIALDAGSSLGFYHNAHMQIQPRRKLTNAILIYDDRQRYARFKDRLTPFYHLASGK